MTLKQLIKKYKTKIFNIGSLKDPKKEAYKEILKDLKQLKQQRDTVKDLFGG